MAALKASRPPPTDFPDVVVPAWTKFNGYITTGGLQHAPNVVVSGLKVSELRRAAPAGAAGSRGPCWAWSIPEGFSFGKACVYSHSTAKKYRAGDGGSGSGSNSGGGSDGSIFRGGGSGSGGGTSSGRSSARAGDGTRSDVRFSAASTAAFVVVDRRLVFGWRNSPGFYCLFAGAIEHVHVSTSFDDAVVTPPGIGGYPSCSGGHSGRGGGPGAVTPGVQGASGTGRGGDGYVLGPVVC